jgi:hypothetical protein
MLLGAAALLAGPAARPALAATCSVPSAQYTTIASALADPNCSTVNVAAGTYDEHSLSITHAVTVMGAAAGSTIIDGQSAGGVISVGSGVIATLNNLTIRNGNSGSGSGGVLNQGTVTLTNVTLSDNTGGQGGGIFNLANATLTNVTLSGNTASLGGGMNNNGGAATLTNVTLSGNTATIGGGILNLNSGTATLTNVTLSGNTASSGGSGGGMNNNGGAATLTLTNVTLSGNTGGNGGGILNNGGAATLTNVTLSGNTASGGGGGIYNNGGTVTLRSGVLAASPCLGTVTSQGANVSDDATCFSTGGTDLANTNPQLGPLANNGGPTVGAPGATSVLQTNALMAGSPAIDYDRRLPAAGDR